MVDELQDISEAEAAVYDRQIRLWGLDAQKRLRSSSVLIAGLNGLGSEVCKNIILSGVKSVLLLDNQNVTKDDFCCQFLVDRKDIGKNRAECSRERAQNLNPMVDVKVDTQELTEKTEDFFNEFDVVCVCGLPLMVANKINAICHRNNIKFFSGEVYGFYGYSFSDLCVHTFVEETKKNSTSNNKSEEIETIVTKKELEFSSLELAVGDFSTIYPRICPSYFVLRVMSSFYETYGRYPSLSESEEDLQLLVKLKNHVLDTLGMKSSKLEDSFANQIFAELSPVCAVIGGVIAQEIIKAVSCKDKPLDNFFFFNGTTSNGTVEHFGPR